MLHKTHNNGRLMADNTTQPDPSQRRFAAERFLASVEQRAFRMAVIATRQRDEAMDIVQDTMLAWVKHYLGHPQEGWKPLFYKVLQNRIRDWRRRTLVRRRIMVWLGRGDDDGEEHFDQLAAIADPVTGDPASVLAHRQTLEKLLRAVERLPLRQQQAFLLRSWEGLDVSATALAMGCSEGSVKTHLSRAMTSLRASVEDNL
jgi:RNA polymerase sigma-70 factor (ECF subfamily)